MTEQIFSVTGEDIVKTMPSKLKTWVADSALLFADLSGLQTDSGSEPDSDTTVEEDDSNLCGLNSSNSCMVDGVTFCNFDYGDSGFCEKCEDYSYGDDCYYAGLPDLGADDCAYECFKSSDDTEEDLDEIPDS